MQAKSRNNVDILTEIRGAYSYLAEKQQELKIVNEQKWAAEDELKEAKENKKKAKTQEEKQSWQLRVEALEEKVQKYGDRRADRYESMSKAEGEVEKILKKYGFEGKTLEEIIKSMSTIQEDISALITRNSEIAKLLKELNEKINGINDKIHETFEQKYEAQKQAIIDMHHKHFPNTEIEFD